MTTMYQAIISFNLYFSVIYIIAQTGYLVYRKPKILSKLILILIINLMNNIINNESLTT